MLQSLFVSLSHTQTLNHADTHKQTHTLSLSFSLSLTPFLFLTYFRCEDYYGIRLVQQLRAMPDKMKARAEIAVYMHNFDEAEAIYR